MNQPRYIAVIWSGSLEKIPNFKTPFESHVNKTDCQQKNRSSTTAIILYPFQMTPLFFLDAKNPSMFWIPNMFFSWISTYYTSIHTEKSLLSYIYPFLSKQIRFNNNKKLVQQTSGRSTCRPFFHKKTPWRSPPWEISCFAWPFWSPYVAFPRPSWGHQLQPKHHGNNDELPWDPRRRRVSFFGGEGGR